MCHLCGVLSLVRHGWIKTSQECTDLLQVQGIPSISDHLKSLLEEMVEEEEEEGMDM